MYEHRNEPLLPLSTFLRRLAGHVGIAVGMIASSLAIGILGYHLIEGLAWVDALLNASMILGGMGPVDVIHTDAGKLFASFYALYSGIIFLLTVGIIVAPVFHRILHHFHLEQAGEDSEDGSKSV